MDFDVEKIAGATAKREVSALALPEGGAGAAGHENPACSERAIRCAQLPCTGVLETDAEFGGDAGEGLAGGIRAPRDIEEQTHALGREARVSLSAESSG
jgi:hypothetical protein